MSTLIRFIANTSLILYALIAIGVLFAFRGLVQARAARRVAVFGLEREAAQERQRRSLSSLITLILLAGMVYVISTIVAPNLSEEIEVPTPTPIVFVTPVPSPTQAILLFPTITPTVGLPPAEATAGPSPTPGEAVNGCDVLGATITNPVAGQVVSGQVVVEGQANILNFAQYKFEINGPATNGAWAVVGTFISPVPSGYLGTWDSTSLMPGNYTLRLVVIRQDGTYVTPCEVPVVVAGPGG